jgi:hypothetical protein
VPQLRVWLPVSLLLGVAFVQIVLTRTADLSPWKGGGFGMFAATDGGAFRRARIFVEAPERSEELEIPASLELAAARAELFPTDRLMAALARGVAAREERHGRRVATVRIEIWRTEFSSPPIGATERRLRSYAMRTIP